MYLKIPAKALLFGEYGVLHTGKALVCVLPEIFFEIEITTSLSSRGAAVSSRGAAVSSRGAAVSSRGLTAGPSFRINTNFSNSEPFFEKILLPWSEYLKDSHVTMTIHKSFPPDLGFGSSSAIIAAVSYALFCFVHNESPTIENEFLWKQIRASLCYAQGIASGYDVGVQLWSCLDSVTDKGKAPKFFIYQNKQNTDVPHIERWHPPIDSKIIQKFGCFIKINLYSDTAYALKSFSTLRQDEKDFFVAEHKKIADEFLNSPNYSTMISCMNASVQLAKKQGIYVDAPITHLLTEHAIPFKTMGSGYGDCLWVAATKKDLLNLNCINESDIVFDFEENLNEC